jgi:large subunit ribosomal protein L7e
LALKKLRLGKLHFCVFLKHDAESAPLMAAAEPYVTFGVPTEETITKLIRIHGSTYLSKKRKTLKDNSVIEKVLGVKGILCVEDLIYEISNGTELFRTSSRFLNPFLLNAPQHTFAKKNSFQRGGDYGDRGDKINELVEQMK